VGVKCRRAGGVVRGGWEKTYKEGLIHTLHDSPSFLCRTIGIRERNKTEKEKDEGISVWGNRQKLRKIQKERQGKKGEK